MGSRASTAFLLSCAAGCTTPGKLGVPLTPNDGGAKLLESIEFRQSMDRRDDLAIVHEDGNLYIGASREETLDVFRAPEGAAQIGRLPKKFGKRFSSFGWESESFAFGCITYAPVEPGSMDRKEIVVQAMYTQDDVDDEVVQKLVGMYVFTYGDPDDVLPGSRIGYWFWHRPGRRLMVNTAVDTKGAKSLTVAVGETQVMTLLGMAPSQARLDKSLAIQRLNAAQGD